MQHMPITECVKLIQSSVLLCKNKAVRLWCVRGPSPGVAESVPLLQKERKKNPNKTLQSSPVSNCFSTSDAA